MNKEENAAAFDHLEIRCPRLGGEVTFGYCRQEGGDLPCPRTIICWQVRFPVALYMRGRLTDAQWEQCFGRPPKDKMITIVELIEAAKKNKKEP